MGRLYYLIICTLALFYCVVGEEDVAGGETLLPFIEREFLLASSAVKNITIRTDECKIQLIAIASDYIAGLDFATFPLNHVIPSLPSDGALRSNLNDLATIISYVSNDLQKALYGDSEILKSKLAEALLLAYNYVKDTEAHFKVDNAFARVQLARKNCFAAFVLYKLKYHALLFEKSNKELEEEIVNGAAHFVKMLKTMTVFDDVAKRGLQDISHSLSIVAERTVNKLKNWVEINSNNTAGIEVVDEVAETISEIFDKLNRASSEKQTAQHMKIQLLRMLKTGLRAMQQLAGVQDSVELGRHEFVRSVLFSAISVGHGYGDVVEATLAYRKPQNVTEQ